MIQNIPKVLKKRGRKPKKNNSNDAMKPQNKEVIDTEIGSQESESNDNAMKEQVPACMLLED